MFIRSFLFRHGPTPVSIFEVCQASVLRTLASPFIGLYRSWWERSRVKLIAWHRHELKQIDFRFALQDASRELINAREAARGKGIGPLDPKYPDIEDFLPKNVYR